MMKLLVGWSLAPRRYLFGSAAHMNTKRSGPAHSASARAVYLVPEFSFSWAECVLTGDAIGGSAKARPIKLANNQTTSRVAVERRERTERPGAQAPEQAQLTMF